MSCSLEITAGLILLFPGTGFLRIVPIVLSLFKNRGREREKIGNIFFGTRVLTTVGVRNVKAIPTPDDWDERDDAVAAGSICPVPDCGALAVSYRTGRDHAKPWCEFTCPRCGIDFAVPEDELIFQSVPKQWLLARVQAE